MNDEERLAQTLHAALDNAQPSPELADRIVERVAVAGSRTVRFSFRLGFAGAALVVAIALVPLVLSLRSNGGPNGGGRSGEPTPSASPTGSLAASFLPAEPLAHFDRDGLAFDYPASWHATVSGLNMHYITILDYIGTGSGLATCSAITPGPSDKFLSGMECGSNISVGPGQVVVTLSRSDGPPRPGPIDPIDPSGISVGEKYVTVGGLPAIFSDTTAQSLPSTQVLNWTLSVPGQLISRYLIAAEIKGPGADALRAQVDALVATIRYDPPVRVLNPADGPQIAEIGVARVKSLWGPEYACFPSVPGASATATITQFPASSTLRKPLPVTCTMAIEPVVIGLWKMTLTESWTAASDRSAGSLTTIAWLDPDGTPGASESGPRPSDMPYLP